MNLQQLIDNLQTKDHFLLAIDGMCASGKSTLAKQLSKQLNAHVFHMDDFYLPLELRTSQRLNQPGGNVHYERFLETVLLPLSQEETVYYQPFDCSKMQLSDQITKISYHPYNIVEGSYALRPELTPYYTDIIVLKISPQEQIDRLMKRNPDKIDDFVHKWIPLENQYFKFYHIYENDSVITLSKEHIL